MSYNEWLSQQPKDFQDAALGKKRAQDYRSGRYKADKYREYGKPITLKELNQLDETITLQGDNDA